MSIRKKADDRVGEKINDWKLVSYDKKQREYSIECKCGSILKKPIGNIIKQKCCSSCHFKDKSKSYIGKKINKLTVIDSVHQENKNFLKVLCQCGNTYLLKPYQLKKINGCCKCKNGFYPGAIIDGMEILEYLGNSKYKIKCVCGNLFDTRPRKYLGKYPTCGCTNHSRIIAEANKNVGIKFEYFKVTKVLGVLDSHVILELKCKCGNTVLRRNGQIRKSKSCGCMDSKSLPNSEKASNAKLSNIEILAMRDLFESGNYTVQDLMDMYALNYSYVRRIVTRKIWKHI